MGGLFFLSTSAGSFNSRDGIHWAEGAGAEPNAGLTEIVSNGRVFLAHDAGFRLPGRLFRCQPALNPQQPISLRITRGLEGARLLLSATGGARVVVESSNSPRGPWAATSELVLAGGEAEMGLSETGETKFYRAVSVR